MKQKLISLLEKETKLSKKDIEKYLSIPPTHDLGDFAFPCFALAKQLKKSPDKIAEELKSKIKLPKEFEKLETKGPYLNFFVNRKLLSEELINKISKEKSNFGKTNIGKSKKIVVEFSSPNIAKPFGIGHLRSTIIGNSIAKIHEFQGFKVIRMNYLGDWGTQFGKLITGYKKFGSETKLKKDPINHLLEIYIKVNKDKELDQESRDWFKKLEQGDKQATALWKKFKDLSIKDFKKIYDLMNIKFDVYSGESFYNKKMKSVLEELKSKKLLEKSDGALIVNLEKYNLGVSLIQKSDGATLYATRDLAAAIDRYEKYKFSKMFYDVGSEQKLHFDQFFKILELMGKTFAKDCHHISHGLYLGTDGKRLATRKGRTIFMQDILDETKELAKKEIISRFPKLSKQELEKRAKAITLAAIFYGDLKNFREQSIVFDIKRFVSFEGNTGPYLLYSYARASSIKRKIKSKSGKLKINELHEYETKLIKKLESFPEIVQSASEKLNPALIANYSYQLAQIFNEFYHHCPVIGSENESFRIKLVEAFRIVMKSSLSLLGIGVLEEM